MHTTLAARASDSGDPTHTTSGAKPDRGKVRSVGFRYWPLRISHIFAREDRMQLPGSHILGTSLKRLVVVYEVGTE